MAAAAARGGGGAISPTSIRLISAVSSGVKRLVAGRAAAADTVRELVSA